MKLAWSIKAWSDYLYWQKTDKQKLKRINELIKDGLRNAFSGIGNPEPLKHELKGFWSFVNVFPTAKITNAVFLHKFVLRIPILTLTTHQTLEKYPFGTMKLRICMFIFDDTSTWEVAIWFLTLKVV